MTCKPLFDLTNIANGSNRRLIQHNLSSHFPDKRRFPALMTRSWRPTVTDVTRHDLPFKRRSAHLFHLLLNRRYERGRGGRIPLSEAEERSSGSGSSRPTRVICRRRPLSCGAVSWLVISEATHASRPLYCELVAARSMYLVSTWVGGPESFFRFARGPGASAAMD